MKFLIVRFSSIGDVVLTTPVVRCIKEQQPEAIIHFITKKSYKAVLDANPYIDQLITIEHSIDEVLETLKENNYDFVIDLHHNIRTFRLKRSLKRPSSAFPKKNFSKFLLTTFKLNRLPKVHVVDRYFETVKQFKIVPDNKPADFFLTEKDELELSDYALLPKQYLAVSMGAQFATKQMPILLLKKVLTQIDCPIVLLGGDVDVARADELTSQLTNKKIINFCGTVTLKQSAFLLKQSALLLTGDTGLMHIASCFEIPIVSVWGNTVPDFGMYAYYPTKPELATIHEVKGLSCRPCSKIGYQKCPKKHFNCMNLQDETKIIEAITKFLQKTNVSTQ